ncbi:hypothetical protein GCK32_020103, partial [Trichostrongylus colubriformis]
MISTSSHSTAFRNWPSCFYRCDSPVLQYHTSFITDRDSYIRTGEGVKDCTTFTKERAIAMFRDY